MVLSQKPAFAFQSTHPVRGGTRCWRPQKPRSGMNFNPPTPCGVGPSEVDGLTREQRISIHPPRAGWDPCPLRRTHPASISIHPPRAGWDSYDCVACGKPFISIHPPRAGWDVAYLDWLQIANPFQSTHPVRGGTIRPARALPRFANFNPPTPCGVGQGGAHPAPRCIRISIHPPRAGWDDCDLSGCDLSDAISIHPPRAGWDFRRQRGRYQSISFQSTHPVRGGTFVSFLCYTIVNDFNPPTPCGVGLKQCRAARHMSTISIHPPRAGWDGDTISGPRRPPISIHPPRAGWDHVTFPP